MMFPAPTNFEKEVFAFLVVFFLWEISGAVVTIARCLKWFVDYERDQKRALEREP
jgi:hypothetical protein